LKLHHSQRGKPSVGFASTDSQAKPFILGGCEHTESREKAQRNSPESTSASICQHRVIFILRYDLDQVGSDIAYKLLASTVMPRPIAWVVTIAKDGSVNCAPYSFFNAMGSAPPTLAIGMISGNDRQSPVAFECVSISNVVTGPNQTVVIGRVLAVHVDDDCVLDPEKAYIDTPKLDLVARSYGSDYVRSRDVFSLDRPIWSEWSKDKPAK